jgi:hypothetical protein
MCSSPCPRPPIFAPIPDVANPKLGFIYRGDDLICDALVDIPLLSILFLDWLLVTAHDNRGKQCNYGHFA